MRQFSEFGLAIASMAGFALLALAIGLLAATRPARDGTGSGSPTTPDASRLTDGVRRTHVDCTEIIGIFVASLLAAMLAGTAPYWVNLLAFLFLLSRVAHAIAIIGGVGPDSYGLRMSIAGWFVCAILAMMAVVSVFTKV